ncbi:hypothetical protein E2C01_061490 [Portunus trituberculatus]|uniref:Uncharacterized protein n=1 Tax=Portunus trituberculatus TaxID=210409 RepID=A0A5B7HDC0_PORTR|nr:hypothetical protein [Portunus trituberculatus]
MALSPRDPHAPQTNLPIDAVQCILPIPCTSRNVHSRVTSYQRYCGGPTFTSAPHLTSARPHLRPDLTCAAPCEAARHCTVSVRCGTSRTQ